MSVIIRPVQKKDKEKWFQLWSGKEDSYLEFYNALDKVSDETSEYTWSRFFDDTVPICSIVAEVEGEVIGFANYLTHKNTWTVEDALYLNDLYVSNKNRLKGVGRLLIEEVYKQADALNCNKCYWATSFDNYRAQLLYTKVGVDASKKIYLRPPR